MHNEVDRVGELDVRATVVVMSVGIDDRRHRQMRDLGHVIDDALPVAGDLRVDQQHPRIHDPDRGIASGFHGIAHRVVDQDIQLLRYPFDPVDLWPGLPRLLGRHSENHADGGQTRQVHATSHRSLQS